MITNDNFYATLDRDKQTDDRCQVIVCINVLKIYAYPSREPGITTGF
jgi:hypothetical protein